MMMEEEKQTLATSTPMDDNSTVSEQIEIGNSSSSTEEVSGQLDSEQRVSANNLSAEGSPVVSARVDDGSAEVVDKAEAFSSVGAEAQVIESLKREVEELKAQLEASNNQTESFKGQYMRIAADFDNFRKRTQKEKEDLEQQVKSSTISKLLAVVDDFERARSHIKPQTDGEMGIHKSYQSVYKQMVEALKRLGVSPMRPEGKEFDPNLHEAVMRQPTDEYAEGIVMEELVRGYFLGDRILRHAMVKVAAPPENVIPSEEENSETVDN